jgi:Tol biopolymer transport system component
MAKSYRSGKESFSFVDPITGREVLQLTNSGERSVHAYYDNPPWCPVTRRIAFSSMEPGATAGDIYMMDADGSNLTYMAHSRSMSANDGAMAQWSADGKRIYFKDKEKGQPLLAWVEVDTGEQGSYPGDLRMVSPTGNRQVYHSNCGNYADEEVVRGREKFGVFIQDLQTGDSQRIVSVADCWAIHPRRHEIADWHLYIKHTKWSPDGRRLMFVFTNEIRYAAKFAELPHVKDIYVVNADGSGLKRVGPFGNHPIWHPNSQEILTNSPYEGRPNNSLVLSHVDSGERRLATTCIAGSGHPSFSPDGKYICVDHVLSGEGYGSLNLVDVAADQVQHLVHVRVHDHSHVGTHLHPVWSRDGSQILYASDASRIAQLCVINIS